MRVWSANNLIMKKGGRREVRFSNLALGVGVGRTQVRPKSGKAREGQKGGGGVKTVCRVSGAGTNRIFLRPGRRRHWLRTV